MVKLGVYGFIRLSTLLFVGYNALLQPLLVPFALYHSSVLLGTTGPHDNVLKIRPPLVFGRRHADLLLQTLRESLEWAESHP